MGEGERRGRRLTTITGFGAIVASALVAAVGHAESFDRGRDMAAWLGLVPRQFTTGGKPKLLGISKRGNRYLRKQLIHGARAALPYVAERDTPLGRWAKALMMRAHHNVAVVAFANKLARIAWAVLRRGERFAAKRYRRRLRDRRSDTKASIDYGCLREGDDEMA
jgi:transposase